MDLVRVGVWLILNLLLPVSALLLLWIEKASERSGRRRTPIIDTAIAALLTDIRDALVEDRGGISNMSYLTSDDAKSIGKLILTPVDISGTGADVVFAVTKKKKRMYIQRVGIGYIILT